MKENISYVDPRLAGARGLADFGKEIALWWKDKKAQEARCMPKHHPFSGDISRKHRWNKTINAGSNKF